MKCDNCSKETAWLEVVGSQFICHPCINKHMALGLALRTSTDSFRFLMKKLAPKDYEEMMGISEKQIGEFVNIKKFR